MADTKTFTGGCHCGKVRYEAKLALGPVIECNCSLCSKKAHLLTFISADDFKLLSGDDVLTDYQFNTHNIHHLFCSVCGIQSFCRGTGPGEQPTVSINARCLDDLDLSTLTVQHFDGKSR
jgi:hypothetical protein